MLWWTLRQLKSEDSQTAERAALELGTAREVRAVEPLLASLGSRHERVRYAAAWALAEMGERRAVEPLIDAFRNKPAEAYLRALSKLKDRRAIPPLIAALIQEDQSVRQLAATTLEEIESDWAQSPAARAFVPRLLEALQDQRPDVKRSALEALEKIGDRRTVEALIQVMEREAESVGWAVRALGKIEPGWARLPEAKAAVPSLVAVLRSQGFERELAAATLADIGDPRAIDPLIDALRDRNRDLRNAAARALGKIGDPRAIGPLVVAPLDGILDPWVAQQGLNGIDPKWANSGEARAVIPACFQKLTDKDFSLRQYAESTLATIDPNWAKSVAARDAVPTFVQLLEHPDNDVREAAARVLEQIDPGRKS
jgi:HEAT repeat protein